MKTKRIKRPVCYFVGLLAFGLMLYSCLQDETDLDSQETTGKVIKGKNRELSIDVARSWYEAHQTPVVTTRSVVTHFELMTKLHWKKGYENRKGKFEVVEVPLLTRGGAVLMDSETMEKYKETERGKIRNISRMVIIKNLETGEIINFVMHIVGTYDYLMKAKHFEDNSYLYRAPDLSGSVYFYEPEGSLVNGWQYKDGKIVATISQGTEEEESVQEAAKTRIITVPDCRLESVLVEYNECTPFIYEDPEYGLGFGTECRTKTKWETVQVCNDIYYDENGNEQTWIPPMDNNSNGGGGYTPPNSETQEPDQAPSKTHEAYEAKLEKILPTLKSELQELEAKLENINIVYTKLGCASNCEVPAGTSDINVCARFFDYYTTIKDQVSILWHECYHLENGHNQAYTSIKYEDDLYSRIPPELKDAFDAMVDSRVSKAYPDLKGRDREDQLIWEREDFTIIYILSAPQKYINEINTYKAEMERVSAVSLDYSIERHFMLWKNQELLRLSQMYNNNQ